MAIACLTGHGWASPKPLALQYAQPAEKWTEALPIGNGRLGAMVFGGVAAERIQFNEDTLWLGEPHDYSHPDAAKYLPEIRKLIFDGKQKEAEAVVKQNCLSIPLRQLPYQPFGDLLLTVPGAEQAADYQRRLDLDEAVASVAYRVGDIRYTREAFASHPHNAIVVRLTASRPGSLNFTARLDCPHKDASVRVAAPDRLVLSGRLPDTFNGRDGVQHYQQPLRLEAQLRVVVDGGVVEPTSNTLTVRGANAATLLLVAGTSYVRYEKVDGDPHAHCEAALAAVKGVGYDELRRSHIDDYQRLFRRVSIDLGATPKEVADLPLVQRIKGFQKNNDPELAALYFQYGRYLLISCSRPGGQPANLQGLWNDKLDPPWESKYTTNINVEMNYWPAETTNLAECTLPLFDMIDELVKSGGRTAKAHYNCRGWVVHHNTDLWRGTAPINNPTDGCYPCGAAWLCQHLWWHYEFGGDKTFLAKRAYPAMREAALFYADFLVEDPRGDKHWLVSVPSNSPEHGGLVAGPTMDNQIIRDLFRNTIAAGKILGVDKDLRRTLKEKYDRLPPNQIGKWGQLQEWLEDVDKPEDMHRHNSHMWGVFPGDEINKYGTPKLFEAARTSLEHRSYGKGDTGWSMAWKVNLWARFNDGDTALRVFQTQVIQKTLPNLFDLCGPFQIDGNFGSTSGIAEMLLQSGAGEISLLPALPSAWPDGSVSGLRARGGVTVAIAWQGGKAAKATLATALEGTLKLRAPKGQNIATIKADGKAVKFTRNDDGAVSLPVKAGATYALAFKAI
jgi:alpha-L-fucosidase 2